MRRGHEVAHCLGRAAMDLGDDFLNGTMKWAIVTFDPAVTRVPVVI